MIKHGLVSVKLFLAKPGIQLQAVIQASRARPAASNTSLI
jgi:hypothetical protein